MQHTINSFDGKFAFLSNFFEAPVEFEGVIYPTNEHAFQAAKVTDPDLRQLFLTDCQTPGQAKRLGRRITLRPDWETVKISVMEAVVWDKFTRHPDLAAKLLATGDAELVEGTTWHDTFWGIDIHTGEGENHLGQILMATREKLKHLS